MGVSCCSTPEGRATAHKEEGNEQFRHKRYREAVKEYTAGLKEGLEGGLDKTLRAVLCTNRAAAHFYLGELVERGRERRRGEEGGGKSLYSDHL